MPEPEVSPPASPHEDRFWGAPVATARTLRFTDNLLDKELQAGNTSGISLRSLDPPSPSTNHSVSPLLDVEELSENDPNDTLDVASPNEAQLYDASITSSHNEDRDEEPMHRSSEVEGNSPSVDFTSQQSPAAGLNADMSQTHAMKIKVNSEVERITVSLTDRRYVYH
jgi:hypothetical protein